MNRFFVSLRKLCYHIMGRLPFFHRKWRQYTPHQKEVFDALEPGDLIDAWMPFEEEKLAKIPDAHQHRPWVVIAKLDNAVLAWMGSSSLDKHSTYRCVPILSKDYNVWKNGYAVIEHPDELPIDCLINKLDHLHDKEIIEINRTVSMVNARRHKKYPALSDAFEVRKNDVVMKDGALYWIIDDKPNLRAVLLSRDQGKKHNACITTERNQKYWFTSYKFITLKQSGAARLYDHWDHPHVSGSLISERKPEVKKKSSSFHPVFHYPIGQIFVCPLRAGMYIYLYSFRGVDYGVYVEEDGSYQCSTKPYDFELLTKSSLASDEMMTQLLNDLIHANPKKYSWMKRLMTTEE